MTEYERLQAIKEIVEIYKSLSSSSQKKLFNFAQKCEAEEIMNAPRYQG